MYQLFYMPARASLAPHIVLQEIQLPYELKLVNFSKGAQSDPEFLAINPNGRVPALVWDGFPMYESAAITMYLADKHPETRLAPDPHDQERPLYYQWMSYLSTTIQEALNQWFHPDQTPRQLLPPRHSIQKNRKEWVERRRTTNDISYNTLFEWLCSICTVAANGAAKQ